MNWKPPEKKPLNIKATPRPSREMLTYLLTAERGMIDGEVLDNLEIEMLVNELLALQHGAEELAHKWELEARQNLPCGHEDDAQGWRDGADWADQQCAKELKKLMRGEP